MYSCLNMACFKGWLFISLSVGTIIDDSDTMMLLRALAPLSSGFVASNGAVARRAGSQLRFRLAVPALHPLNPHPALRCNVAAVAVVEHRQAWTSRRWFPSW